MLGEKKSKVTVSTLFIIAMWGDIVYNRICKFFMDMAYEETTLRTFTTCCFGDVRY